MHHDLKEKISFEFELFRLSIISQSRESIFTRSTEIFYKTRIYKILNEMNDNDLICFETKQKLMLKSDIIDSIYMYLVEENYDETDVKDFIGRYLKKVIEPIVID